MEKPTVFYGNFAHFATPNSVLDRCFAASCTIAWHIESPERSLEYIKYIVKYAKNIHARLTNHFCDVIMFYSEKMFIFLRHRLRRILFPHLNP